MIRFGVQDLNRETLIGGDVLSSDECRETVDAGGYEYLLDGMRIIDVQSSEFCFVIGLRLTNSSQIAHTTSLPTEEGTLHHNI